MLTIEYHRLFRDAVDILEETLALRSEAQKQNCVWYIRYVRYIQETLSNVQKQAKT